MKRRSGPASKTRRRGGPVEPDAATAGDELCERVGMRVRALRKAQGMTLMQLGERSGLGYRHIIRLEHGEGNVTLRTLARVAIGLGVPVVALFEEIPESGVRRKR